MLQKKIYPGSEKRSQPEKNNFMVQKEDDKLLFFAPPKNSPLASFFSSQLFPLLPFSPGSPVSPEIEKKKLVTYIRAHTHDI